MSLSSSKTIGIGITTWKSYETLEATLKTYRDSGILSLFDRAIIWFQDKRDEDDELAQAYGASLVLAPDDPRLHERILERTDGLGAELVLEAAGAPSSLRTAVDVARKGAKIVVLGVFHEEVALNYHGILMAEKQIMGSIIYQRHDFAEAIDILAAGGVDLPRHVTAEVALRDIVTHGFEPLSANKAEHIKIQVYPEA